MARSNSASNLGNPHFFDYEERLQAIRKELLRKFLQIHGFPSAHQAREVWQCSRVRMEPIYPIHLAALKGDVEIVRTLQEEGADPDETFNGLTALNLAERENENGSHIEVLRVLQEAVKLQCLQL